MAQERGLWVDTEGDGCEEGVAPTPSCPSMGLIPRNVAAPQLTCLPAPHPLGLPWFLSPAWKRSERGHISLLFGWSDSQVVVFILGGAREQWLHGLLGGEVPMSQRGQRHRWQFITPMTVVQKKNNQNA